ncbi:MAG: DNA cytosine methyltransferase [Caulobacteraceae bacterium]
MSRPFTFYEFFAGGGMARLGLGESWRCLFANDFDPVKAAAYRANFPDAAEHFHEGDVWKLEASDLPGRADLAWASSPCQDFSLAGARAGLTGVRSSAFFGFWRLIEQLNREGRAPRMIVIENVPGLLTSHGGEDLRAVLSALDEQGYAARPLRLNASAFLPQSRERLLIVAWRGGEAEPDWEMPAPGLRNTRLEDVLEADDAARWIEGPKADRLLSQLSPAARLDIERAMQIGERRVGALYRRMRMEDGAKVQRAEVRFDGLAGCLRTPKGGSSRQYVALVDRGAVHFRLLTAREGARLMGLPDDYVLPAAETAAWKVVGDGVAVPVVRWLAAHLLEPALAPNSGAGRRAA